MVSICAVRAVTPGPSNSRALASVPYSCGLVIEMIRILLGGLVVAHGLVTAAIWASPARQGEPFRATRLMGLYFNPWLLAGIAISGGVLYAGAQALQQA